MEERVNLLKKLWKKEKLLVTGNVFDSKMEICFEERRKYCGKRSKNAGYQHFPIFPQSFKKTFSSRVV